MGAGAVQVLAMQAVIYITETTHDSLVKELVKGEREDIFFSTVIRSDV